MATIIQGEALDQTGRRVLAHGISHEGYFIVNPYASPCGRFYATPQSYGLSSAEAHTLTTLNRDLQLIAYT